MSVVLCESEHMKHDLMLTPVESPTMPNAVARLLCVGACRRPGHALVLVEGPIDYALVPVDGPTVSF